MPLCNGQSTLTRSQQISIKRGVGQVPSQDLPTWLAEKIGLEVTVTQPAPHTLAITLVNPPPVVDNYTPTANCLKTDIPQCVSVEAELYKALLAEYLPLHINYEVL